MGCLTGSVGRPWNFWSWGGEFEPHVQLKVYFIYFFKFIYLFWEKESVWGGAEREREIPKQAPHWQHRSWRRALIHSEITTWAKTKSWTLNWATQVPFKDYFLKVTQKSSHTHTHTHAHTHTQQSQEKKTVTRKKNHKK